MDEKCSYPEGISIRPDGVNELDPCIYEVVEIHKNVTVALMQCINCGHEEIVWYSQPDSEHIYEITEEDEAELEQYLSENSEEDEE